MPDSDDAGRLKTRAPRARLSFFDAAVVGDFDDPQVTDSTPGCILTFTPTEDSNAPILGSSAGRRPPRRIPPSWVTGAVDTYWATVQMQASVLVVRTSISQTSSGSSAGPDLTPTAESTVGVVLRAGTGETIKFLISDLDDPTEPYDRTLDNTSGTDPAFATAPVSTFSGAEYTACRTAFLLSGGTVVVVDTAHDNVDWDALEFIGADDTELVLADSDDTGLDVDCKALLVAGAPGAFNAIDIVWIYEDSDRGGTDEPLDGELGLGADESLISGFRRRSATVLQLNDNDNPVSFDISAYFDVGGAGNDLTLYLQTLDGGEVSFPVAGNVDPRNAGQVRFTLPADAQTLLDNLATGDRWIFKAARAATAGTTVELAPGPIDGGGEVLATLSVTTPGGTPVELTPAAIDGGGEVFGAIRTTAPAAVTSGLRVEIDGQDVSQYPGVSAVRRPGSRPAVHRQGSDRAGRGRRATWRRRAGGLRPRAHRAPGPALPVRRARASTPWLYWPLDDGPGQASAADISGNGRPGTWTTSPTDVTRRAVLSRDRARTLRRRPVDRRRQPCHPERRRHVGHWG